MIHPPLASLNPESCPVNVRGDFIRTSCEKQTPGDEWQKGGAMQLVNTIRRHRQQIRGLNQRNRSMRKEKRKNPPSKHHKIKKKKMKMRKEVDGAGWGKRSTCCCKCYCGRGLIEYSILLCYAISYGCELLWVCILAGKIEKNFYLRNRTTAPDYSLVK